MFVRILGREEAPKVHTDLLNLDVTHGRARM